MATSFERLKRISHATKDLINGYIRDCEANLFGGLLNQNPYYHIPPIINNYCVLFYDIFTWYKKKDVDTIEFISDTEIKQTVSNWSTCMLENEISNETCDNFSVTFEVISFGVADGPNFCIGYTTKDTIEESIKKWNAPLGESKNKHSSASWAMYDDALFLSAKGEEFVEIDNLDMTYSCGDLFKILIDFKEKQTIKIYQNDGELDCQALDQTKLWIGISLYYKGSQIKMVQYKYD